jgi:hypothetical protein
MLPQKKGISQNLIMSPPKAIRSYPSDDLAKAALFLPLFLVNERFQQPHNL